MTNEDGTVGYYGTPANAFGNSMARSAITVLVFAIAKRKHLPEYETLRSYIVDRMEEEYDTHPYYGRYYMAQALFQANIDAWEKWNRNLIAMLEDERAEDGSIGDCQFGKNYTTAMSLLAIALNYRFLPIYER